MNQLFSGVIHEEPLLNAPTIRRRFGAKTVGQRSQAICSRFCDGLNLGVVGGTPTFGKVQGVQALVSRGGVVPAFFMRRLLKALRREQW